MLGKLLSTVATRLRVRTYRLALDRNRGRFVLQAFRGNTTLPLSQVAASIALLQPFARLSMDPDGTVCLPLRLLDDAKAVLHTLADDGLDVVIGPDIEALTRVDVPADFSVIYTWDPAACALVARLANEATYFGEGWFVAGTHYWQVSGTLPDDDAWLRRDTVQGQDLLALISQVSPRWQHRGLPYTCVIRLEQTPALQIAVTQVREERVELAITWHVPEATIEEVPSLPGYVVHAHAVLLPGISP